MELEHQKTSKIRFGFSTKFTIMILIIFFIFDRLAAQDVFKPEDVFKIKSCTGAIISPNGKWVAYTVRVQREISEKAGRAFNELYLISTTSGEIRPFICGKVNISSPQWSPDGTKIAFLMKRGEKAHTQVWIISASGGEAKQASESKTNVLAYQWHPMKNMIGYTAVDPKSKREKELAKKGYGFIFYEENLKHRNLYLLDLTTDNVEQLTTDRTVWDFVFSPDGKKIAGSISSKNLIDHRYMFRKVFILNLEDNKLNQLTNNPGKLGNYVFSPDGKKLAYAAALTREDHQISQAYVIDIAGGEAKNLTIPDFQGHVNWVGWKNNKTVIYRAGEGVWPTLSHVSVDGGNREIILSGKDNNIIFGNPNSSKNGEIFAMVASSSTFPPEVYVWKKGENIEKLTTLNPWLDEKSLGEQVVINYKARDDFHIEGLLIQPVGYKSGEKYPLIVYVHGGPEYHNYNTWLTRYSTPGQVMSGKGYFVFYPNYRASTGYGVKFAMEGYGDPAGKEFDDIADGIDYLVKEGMADKDRVGLAGGSYGGYASAWFATYYTKYVKAVCMFVGISDLISKQGTTDIAYEDMYVHMGKTLEEMWDLILKRSPIYWAHQSKTAVLIYGGAVDTRVHPSQSMEFYRRLKVNEHPAVRLVQYPGEGHGNAKQPGQIDVLQRQIQWLDWYVRDKNPLDGPMPALDISENYGLDLETEKKQITKTKYQILTK
jgi:dipeptidyl aminopeptidase/acylaminoacyl peptidase